jgi:UDP-N-acetylglucosamine--N-acetylmuramyl-(pentapeptide) pyrophosphoryl-undecaprenol N-acetylglucosamine transferase
MRTLLRNVRSLLHFRRSKAEKARAANLLRDSSEAGDELEPTLRALLASDAWEARNDAIKAIAKTRCEPLLPVLAEAVVDRREVGIVRRNAAEMLRQVDRRSRKITGALREALSDPYWEVRAEAARALARLAVPSEATEQALLDRLTVDGNFEARAGLVEALGALGTSDEAFARLVALVEEGPWLVRHQAAVAMVEMAARRREHADDAARVLRELDLLSEGTVTTSVFRRHILELIALTQDGRTLPAPDVIRKEYLHLKQGWLRNR